MNYNRFIDDDNNDDDYDGQRKQINEKYDFHNKI